jgi:hypothetical protein
MDLIEELASFSDRPYDFVLWAFPWGEPGSELETETGPNQWQTDYLLALQADISQFHRLLAELQDTKPIQTAVTSGHGVGKSALVAWLILWGICTFEDAIGVVTANTENQLKTKTWKSLSEWHRLFIAREFFKMTATSMYAMDPEHERTWKIDMVPWSERNTEAFAGLHNKRKRIMLLFDEGSAIPDLIYEVSEGALTDQNTQIIWGIFGNPTRNKGRFRECFPGGRFAHRWRHQIVDSRTVPFTNKTQIAEWIEDHGEDSDFVRVRVLGKFPRVDAESFIGYELARDASVREILPQGGPIVIGVDVGRFGDDPSVIYPRRGRDARTFKPEFIYKQDTMFLAARVAETFLRIGASIVFVDVGGVGGGVVDRLRQLQIPVVEVDFGAGADGVNPDDGSRYANKRAEIWGAMRNFLKTGAVTNHNCGPNTTFIDELTGPTYGLNGKEAILLESKKAMRARKVPSPNCADALACTFAAPSFEAPLRGPEIVSAPVLTPDYDPFSHSRIYG